MGGHRRQGEMRKEGSKKGNGTEREETWMKRGEKRMEIRVK